MKQSKFTLKASKRDIFGRKVNKYRKEGLIPANIFGKNIKSESVFIKGNEFLDVFKKAGETQIIDLDGKPVLVSNIQSNPVTSEYLHVDFRQVDLTEKITAKVPVEIIGEALAEKQKIGTVVQQISEIEVESLPADLPEKIEVDSSILTEVDQAIYVKDLKLDKNVTIKTDLESIIVKVEPPTKEEVVEVAPEVAPAPVEGETTPVVESETKAPESNSDQSS